MPADLDARSLELRTTMVRMLEEGGRGHVGAAFSLVEILRVLYDDVLRYDPDVPKWPERDRFILSKGHGCLAQWVLLADKGFFPESELWKFCKSDGILGGHPEIKAPGVEASTGSLGHGLSIGIGFAINARYERAGHRIFVVVGDGECNEGSIWEGAMCAGKYGLSNLVVLIDNNGQQSYGPTAVVQDMEPLSDKWTSFGFGVAEVDGHSVDQLRSVLSDLPIEADRPSAVVCRTVKGKGVDFVENNPKWHHQSSLSDEDIQTLYSALQSN